MGINVNDQQRITPFVPVTLYIRADASLLFRIQNFFATGSVIIFQNSKFKIPVQFSYSGTSSSSPLYSDFPCRVCF